MMTLMRTGATVADATSAASSWISSEIPKLEAELAAWERSIPMPPTQAQAQAAYVLYGDIVYQYGQRLQAAVYTPYKNIWDLQASDASVQAANSAIAAEFARVTIPYRPLLNDVIRPARLGLTLTELDTKISQADKDMAAAMAAWEVWQSGSAPHLAQLRSIFEQARANPYTSDVDALSELAISTRNALESMAQQALGAAPTPIGYVNTIAKARQTIQMAYEEADSQLQSNLRLRGMLADAQRQGYDVNFETGESSVPGTRPVGGFLGIPMGPAAAILGGLALVFFLRRRRKS